MSSDAFATSPITSSIFTPAAKAAPAFVETEEVIEEPVVKRSKKAEAPPTAPKANLADVVSAWSDS